MNARSVGAARGRGKRRAEILGAAARLFAERGYAGTSVDDVGEAVGVSGPAIYWHFESKEALLAEMLVGISETLLAEGVERVAAESEPAATLASLVRFHVAFALEQPDLITVHQRELNRLPDDARRRVRTAQRRYAEEWVATLAELQPDADAETLRTVVQAAFGLINSTPYLGHGRSAGELAIVLEQMAIAALERGAAAAAGSDARAAARG